MDNDFYERMKNVSKIAFTMNFFPQLIHDLHYLYQWNAYLDPIHAKDLTVAMMLSTLYPNQDELFSVMFSFQCAALTKHLALYMGLSKNKSDFLAFSVRALIRSGAEIYHISTMILVFCAYTASLLGQTCEHNVVYQLSRFC